MDINTPNFCAVPFCYAPWVAANIRGTIDPQEGNKFAITPCCAWTGRRYYGSPADMENSTIWNEIKQDMLDYNMSKLYYSCSECIEEEQANVESLRLRLQKQVNNGWYKIGYINWLDIRPSNLCNLKCIICSANSSSMIAKEEKKYYKNVPLDDLYNIDFTHLKMLKVLGGEPTLQGNALELIDHIAKKTTMCDLQITSNGTNVNHILIEKFLPFKNVFYNLSIDGTGETFNYIRKNANWKAVLENIYHLKEIAGKNKNFQLSLHCTIGAISFLTIDKWIDEYINLDISSRFYLAQGNKHSVRAVPEKYKKSIVSFLHSKAHKYTERIIKIVTACDFDPQAYLAFKSHIKNKDNLRRTNICKLHDYLKEIFL